MKAELFIVLLSIFPLIVWAQTLNYEQQGDELFAQAQYEKALKKYRAAEVEAEIIGQPVSEQLKEKIQKCIDSYSHNDAYYSIQNILMSLSKCRSKGGNQTNMSNFYTEIVSPYVTIGNSKKAKDIPQAVRNFLNRYDLYEVSPPSDLNVQSQGSGYIATYKVIVEWNSKRTGHKKACIQKTTYLNSEYKITGFIDKELWREF